MARIGGGPLRDAVHVRAEVSNVPIAKEAQSALGIFSDDGTGNAGTPDTHLSGIAGFVQNGNRRIRIAPGPLLEKLIGQIPRA